MQVERLDSDKASIASLDESAMAVSMGGCITSALTDLSTVEVVGAVLGTVSSRTDEVWQRWRQGESLRLIARRLGKRGPSVRAFVLQTGGVRRSPVGGLPAWGGSTGPRSRAVLCRERRRRRSSRSFLRERRAWPSTVTKERPEQQRQQELEEIPPCSFAEMGTPHGDRSGASSAFVLVVGGGGAGVFLAGVTLGWILPKGEDGLASPSPTSRPPSPRFGLTPGRAE